MASSGTGSKIFQVFLSFRGEDVRGKFLSHLIDELNRKLVRTVFIDSQIERGHSIAPALLQAIRDSRVSIVVLSKRYGSSSWCLNELLEILKCREKFGQIVMTIFYEDVEPSHVRYQFGEFGEVFKTNCMNKTEDEEKQWRLALNEVANIHGHHSSNWKNEAEMIKDVVYHVSRKLNCSPSSEEFDGLIGIDDHVANMVSLLRLDAEEAMMVGVWGPSGIGKSTISRALFARLSCRFQRSVFIDRSFVDKTLENFRRINLDDYGVKLRLQEKFLSVLLDQKDVKIEHLGSVRGRLSNHKVLIVLDDVDDRLLLDALVGETLLFGSGSRIIVITNDVHLLRSHKLERVNYEVGFPSEAHAFEIFCQSAFGRNSPYDGFMELAVQVSKLAGKLPLGLNLLGSSLRGRNKEDWIDMLPELGSCLNGDIQRTLRFGYNRLKEPHRRLFLHIACLFNGAQVDNVKWLLADSDVDVNTGLRVLVERSLIRLKDLGKTVEMHSLLQQMGRGIVSAKSFDEPGERQFLIDSNKICDVLQDNTGTSAVLGIAWDTAEIDELLTLEEGAFERMCNLRFLKIYRTQFKGSDENKLYFPQGIKSLSRRLRLLHWEAYPMKCMPSNFSPANLVELDMANSKLEKMWEGTQPLMHLKSLKLRNSLKLKEVPDLSRATNLEELSLASCQSLEMIPPHCIQNLSKLKTLAMELCINLELLPTNINLESLSILSMRGCFRSITFPGISRNISVLFLEHTLIEEVPHWVENISGLTRLHMTGCRKLRRVSANISKLKHIEKVDFSLCLALTEDSWENDPQVVAAPLGYLDLSFNGFTRLPHSLVSIKPYELNISHCRDLVSLPELQVMSLKILRAEGCVSLESISYSFQNPETILHFNNCFKLDQESLVRSSVFKYMVLPGGEVPAGYFNHRASGSFLIVPFPRSSLAGSVLRFKACILFDTTDENHSLSNSCIRVWCLLKGKEVNHFHNLDLHILSFSTPLRDKHLGIFDCCFSLATLNYDEVKIDFGWDGCEIKGCGIQFISGACPSLDNQSGASCEQKNVKNDRLPQLESHLKLD